MATKDEKGKEKETMEGNNTKKTHQKSPDNDNKRTGRTDPGAGENKPIGKSDNGIGAKLIQNMNDSTQSDQR